MGYGGEERAYNTPTVESREMMTFGAADARRGDERAAICSM